MGTPVDPLGWVILAATAVGAGANAYGQIAQGKAAKGMYAAEARARELEAKQADLATTQIAAQRMQELNANLGAIIAMRAGKNTLGDSPTGEAIIRSFTKESLGARSNEILEARLRALSARNAMAAAQMQGRAAGQAGTIGAIGALAGGVAQVGGTFYRPAKPSATALKKPRPTGRSGSKTSGEWFHSIPSGG